VNVLIGTNDVEFILDVETFKDIKLVSVQSIYKIFANLNIKMPAANYGKSNMDYYKSIQGYTINRKKFIAIHDVTNIAHIAAIEESKCLLPIFSMSIYQEFKQDIEKSKLAQQNNILINIKQGEEIDPKQRRVVNGKNKFKAPKRLNNNERAKINIANQIMSMLKKANLTLDT